MRLILRTLLAFIAAGLFVVVGLVIAYWAPDLPMDTLKSRWAAPPSQFIALNGMQVHVRDEGPRNELTPVVLLHGTSASLHTWDGWVSKLAKERRVIRFDLPGFGLTGPSPTDDYRRDTYTNFVVAMFDAMNVKKVILAGNSLGGNLAWATAATHPSRVERLILVDAGGYAFTPASVPLGFRMAQMPAMHQLMRKILPRAVIESSLKNVYGDPSKVTADLVDRYYDLARREGNRRALGLRFTQMQPGDQAEKIPSLKLPTLILWGGQDRLVPVENAHRFNRDIAGSQLQIFDRLGHGPHEEDPEVTFAAVKTFIANPL